MYMQNRRHCVIIILLVAGLVTTATAQNQQKTHAYKISRGMEVKIMQNDDIQFIHAQLVIYYKSKPENPALPYLTMLNIFDRNVKKPDTAVLNNLRKLGNDYQIDARPDFLLIKTNFLPDKIPIFIRFLKSLYNYRPLLDFDINPTTYHQRKRKANTEQRFQDSINNYWKYFFKKKGWKKSIAYQLAYHQLFPDSLLGTTKITPAHLKGIKLEHLNVYYKKNYRLQHSMLILKGKINKPPVVYGSIERAFSSIKKPKLEKNFDPPFTIKNQKKIIIFNTSGNESPAIFWFEPIAIKQGMSPIPAMVINHLLFGYPTGRIFITATRFTNIRNFRIQSEMVSHKGVSVICNTIRLRYRDIEKFILLASREKKKLNLKGIQRKESLDTQSYIYGRTQVDTQDVGHDINTQILDIPVSYSRVTLVGLNESTATQYSPVIIVVGNATIISRFLTVLSNQIEIVNLTK
jgi:hypothetical protein